MPPRSQLCAYLARWGLTGGWENTLAGRSCGTRAIAPVVISVVNQVRPCPPTANRPKPPRLWPRIFFAGNLRIPWQTGAIFQ
jgi:hypothetical protein